MPKNGAVSMFSFGYTAGFAYGMVLANNLPHTFVTPQKWKKIVGIKGSDGEVSRKRASQLYPGTVDLWKLKGDDGVAEAALIAHAGIKLLEGK
jgi:crossover junction endodeoxyribonuclease RuvC